jgi:hypothetical protein
MRHVRLLLLVTAVLGSVACSDSAAEPELAVAGPESARAAGTYTLTQVVGQSLPVGFQLARGGGVFIDGGALTVGADGRFSLRVEQRFVQGATGTPTLRTSGRYTYSPADSSFTVLEDSTGKTSRGALDGKGRLTLPVGGVPFLFTRR